MPCVFYFFRGGAGLIAKMVVFMGKKGVYVRKFKESSSQRVRYVA